MSRSYSDDSSGCGCALFILGVYAVAFIYGVTTDYYKHLEPTDKPYFWLAGISLLAIGLIISIIVLYRNKSKEAELSDKRFQNILQKNIELSKNNKKLELSEKCAWDTLEKERKALLIAHNRQNAEFQNKKSSLELEYQRLRENCTNQTSTRKLELEQEYASLRNKCLSQTEQLRRATGNMTPFRYVASMLTDLEMCVFKDAEKWMKNKKNPAFSTAEKVKELRVKSRECFLQYKEMEYKYSFLLSVFPELKKYVDDEEELLHLSDFKGYDDFSDNRDRVEDWITSEEYMKLSVNERNQLAFDRYKKRNKSKWEIGMEYELYIGYVLRKDGFYIKQFGIENGLNDLGRDIIAEKAHLDGTRSIYIIQCKNWSKEKELHENVVCQLYGTTLEYQINHPEYINTRIIPLLVTTTKVSQTAEKFSRKLEVVVKTVPFGEYPMIKCNINNDGERIYHLPFDQQYWRTRIEKPGEFYAWSVKEAVEAGFRRAMRWVGNN